MFNLSLKSNLSKLKWFAMLCFLVTSLLYVSKVSATELPCTGSTNPETCEGPYDLIWKPYNTFDSVSSHFHVIALTDIAEAFTVEPAGFRVPTIKELITIVGLDGVSYPTVDSWLLGNGYLISSTPGGESGGVKKIMAIEVASKAIVELPMIRASAEVYYLLSVKNTAHP